MGFGCADSQPGPRDGRSGTRHCEAGCHAENSSGPCRGKHSVAHALRYCPPRQRRRLRCTGARYGRSAHCACCFGQGLALMR